MGGERQDPRGAAGFILDDLAIGQSQDHGIGILAQCEEPALARRDRQDLAFRVRNTGEDPAELAPVVTAALDPQRHVIGQGGEFAHLD